MGSEAQEVHELVERNMNSTWVILNTINILMMQAGFALFEAGTIDRKNTKAVLMKNLMDASFGALAWYFVGFGLYTGDSAFAAGPNASFVTNSVADFESFFLVYSFAVTTSTIVSGAVVGRMHLKYYLLLSFVMVAIVFPLVAHWVWNSAGFLNSKYVDFAGGVCVHAVGGVVALLGAWYSGPRVGRFTMDRTVVINTPGSRVSNGVAEIVASSPGMQTLGALMLFCSWFSFNAVSAGSVSKEGIEASLRACVNTLLGSSATMCFAIIVVKVRTGIYSLPDALNALLAGLVGVTAGCAYIDTWASCVIGIAGWIVFYTLDYFLLYFFRIDDALAAGALHGGAGTTGAILLGVFHREEGLIAGKTEMFVNQIWCSFLIVGFAAACGLVVLQACYLHGGQSVSVSLEDQVLGLDFKYHDGYSKLDLATDDFGDATSKPLLRHSHSRNKIAPHPHPPEEVRHSEPTTA